MLPNTALITCYVDDSQSALTERCYQNQLRMHSSDIRAALLLCSVLHVIPQEIGYIQSLNILEYYKI